MDLSQFSADQLEALKALISQQLGAAGDGRSPFRPRQLHDLRLQPTKDDPRPTFFWSADPPRTQAPPRPRAYPKLRWHAETGQERTIRTPQELAALGADWIDHPPVMTPETAEERVARALAELSPEDREMVLEANRQAKLARLQRDLADLSEVQAGRVLNEDAPKRRKKAVA